LKRRARSIPYCVSKWFINRVWLIVLIGTTMNLERIQSCDEISTIVNRICD
jgi:hypothetical protein